MKEGKVASWKDNKQQKVAKDPRDKRGTFVDSRDEAEVCQPQRTWAPWIEMEGAPIQYDASIWDTQRPCQLPSTSPTATSPSSKGHGVYSAHKTAQPIHVVKKRSSHG